MLKTSPIDTHHQNTAEQGPKKCIDHDIVTLITTVQQIMTGLQTTEYEKGQPPVIMRAVYGLIM
jgi:hypothetical protein